MYNTRLTTDNRYNLFEGPCMPTARLLVVGIANTMDLPERLLPKIKSRASLDRVDFAPYSREQIVAILRSRLQSLPVFTDDALELCARQVTSVSGDIRRALQLCRRAIELRQSGAAISARASPATTVAAGGGADAGAGGGAGSSSSSSALKWVLDAQDINKAAVSIRSSHHFKLMREGVYFERVALTALVRARGWMRAVCWRRAACECGWWWSCRVSALSPLTNCAVRCWRLLALTLCLQH